MKLFNKIVCNSPLILLILLSGCGPVLNPYNEDFKCRARDDAGECIDTPTEHPQGLPEETSKWLTWANEHAKKIDPLE